MIIDLSKTYSREEFKQIFIKCPFCKENCHQYNNVIKPVIYTQCLNFDFYNCLNCDFYSSLDIEKSIISFCLTISKSSSNVICAYFNNEGISFKSLYGSIHQIDTKISDDTKIDTDKIIELIDKYKLLI